MLFKVVIVTLFTLCSVTNAKSSTHKQLNFMVSIKIVQMCLKGTD